VALAILTPLLLWWQWSAPVRDLVDAVGDPSTKAGFYAPLIEQLDGRTVGAPTRVEVLPTRNRWESVYVAESYPIARGWLRQAESDDFELFKDGHLTPDAYLEWLRERAIGYVAVPQGVDRDYLADDEAALIESGLPYLDLAWSNEDWRLYQVSDEPEFVTPVDAPGAPAANARMASLGPTSFELTAERPGDYLVRVRYTRYWAVASGDACIERDGDWTVVRARSASVIRVEARFDADSLLGGRDSC
jgi:hypothetical protein